MVIVQNKIDGTITALRAMTGHEGESAVMLFVIFPNS
jgi:hypothetical protein